ncbi:MAG: ABC transporter ATP-binding protein [Myxococcota bacterium]
MRLDFEEVAVSGLTKSYGATLALAGVNLKFSKGTVTAVLGANGSGKSTLLWLLALLGRPTRGEVRFGEHDARSAAELRARIGFVAHQLQLYPGLSGQENLALAAKLHGLADGADRAQRLAEQLTMADYWERPLRTYSRGQAQRVAIARALLHEPRLLLMDEPSTGLDERSTETLIAQIAHQRASGAIVVVVSHELSFAERIADRVVVIDRGRISEADA